jgi:hypothetical protein
MNGQAQMCESCSVYTEVPKGQDYLAVCVRDIQGIMQKRGSVMLLLLLFYLTPGDAA